MEASIEFSNTEVCCSETEFLTAKKTNSAAAEEGCTNTVCKQQTSEGVDLRISSTTLAYPLQKKHHPLLQGNLEVLFLNPLFNH